MSVSISDSAPALTRRGEERRQQIVEAAAALVRENGPAAVTHREVAKRAGCSLSATTYYFEGLEDLLHQAGQMNICRWAKRAENAASEVEAMPAPVSLEDAVRVTIAATLPTDEAMSGHYLQLVRAGEYDSVASAYRTGRERLNEAISRVLKHVDVTLNAEMIIAVVDGAAVSALSEGRDVRETVEGLVREIFEMSRKQNCCK